MADIPKKDQDKLPELKKNVEQWNEYFRDNILRYNDFMRFVFKSGLTSQDVATLQDIGKPTLEFNILEPYISRQRGEFDEHQPNLTVRAADGMPVSSFTPQFTQTIKVIEAHLRAIFADSMNDNMSYKIFSDLLAGGFSVMQVYTDYVNEMSFEQNIYVDRVFDPTLCVFDPLARDSHKGDGRYCAFMYPMTREEFEKEFGKEFTEKMRFTRELSGFGWSFRNEKEDIVLVCDFYEKERKKERIIKLTNGHVTTVDRYKKFLEAWESDPNIIEVPPQPVGEPRTTYIEKIRRYRFCETGMLEKSRLTNYKHLPLVFVDGNSVTLSEGQSSYQMTRPAVYHAKGIQRLKTFAGQTLANELENMVQHKWIVPIESIPTDYQEAYKNVQKADVLAYNHFLDTNNTEVTLPPPQPVVRTPIPPVIMETFRISDEMTQAILGSYDNQMGINRAALSGVAIARGAMQSNMTFKPYVVGYINGLNRIGQIIIDLIPKYYRTPRSLPVMLPSGKRDYVLINRKGSLYMNYDPNSLQIKVEAGVNFALQKEIALQTITTMMQASPTFAQFINQYGLPILLDNIDIRGIEELKQKAEEFQQQMQQSQAMQMQMGQQQQQMQDAMMQTEWQLKQKELQAPNKNEIDMFKAQHGAAVDEADLNIKEQKTENDFLELMAKIRNEEVDNELSHARIQAENSRSAIDLAIQLDKHLANKAGEESDG